MTQAAVLAFVDSLGGLRADGTPLAERSSTTTLYADVGLALARDVWVTQVTLLPTTAGTAVYSPGTTTVRVLAAFWDDRALARTRIDELRWTSVQWRDDRGDPVAWVQAEETTEQIRVAPMPDVGSAAFTYDSNTHLGAAFPANALSVVATETRIDYPGWLDLPLALLVLAREFSRESDHRDPAFAGACEQLGRVTLAMVR